jgi:hypothetical protein
MAVQRPAAHVPADVALWPQPTGAEILELLVRTGPGIDVAYRGEFVERFELDMSKPARTYSATPDRPSNHPIPKRSIRVRHQPASVDRG